jgi:hypothetical protein
MLKLQTWIFPYWVTFWSSITESLEDHLYSSEGQ